MKKTNNKKDIEICKMKIRSILKEYNCSLMDFDDGDWVLLVDNDTGETINVNK